MKKKNLDRYELVAQNLLNQAESERKEYLDKLKHQRNQMKTVETYFKKERSTENKHIKQRHDKHQAVRDKKT